MCRQFASRGSSGIGDEHQAVGLAAASRRLRRVLGGSVKEHASVARFNAWLYAGGVPGIRTETPTRAALWSWNAPGAWGIVLIALIVLKLTGVITWSWWWVLSPMWRPGRGRPLTPPRGRPVRYSSPGKCLRLADGYDPRQAVFFQVKGTFHACDQTVTNPGESPRLVKTSPLHATASPGPRELTGNFRFGIRQGPGEFRLLPG
jgi:hypothetical protein